MILLVILAAALLTISVWGWWAIPSLVSKELDDESRERRGDELRRGVFAYFVAALVIVWLAVAATIR